MQSRRQETMREKMDETTLLETCVLQAGEYTHTVLRLHCHGKVRERQNTLIGDPSRR